MLDVKVFKEIQGSHKFHTCILTTYAFDLYFFESSILKLLRSKGITNILVLVDGGVLDEVLEKSICYASKLSYQYSLYSIVNKGSFHSKICLLFGDNTAQVIMGSGNLTSFGQGKNHETFISFYADNEGSKQLPTILSVWDYALSLLQDYNGILNDQLDWARKYCSLISKKDRIVVADQFYPVGDDIEAVFLSNTTGWLFSKILNYIPRRSIETITIVAPYYDDNGFFLQNLSKEYPKADINVFVQSNNRSALPLNIGANPRISFYDWDFTKRSKDDPTQKKLEKFLHAKIIHFASNTHEFLLIGSANPTNRAFGNKSNEALNDEASLLLKRKGNSYLKELGIVGRKKVTNLKKFAPETLGDNEDKKEVPSLIYNLKSIDVVDNQILMTVNEQRKQVREKLVLFDNASQEISFFDIKSMKFENKFMLKKQHQIDNCTYGRICNEANNAISNNQVISFRDNLNNLCPSSENRTYWRILQRIEIGKFNNIDLIDLYEPVFAELIKLRKEKANQGSTKVSKTTTKNETEENKSFNEVRNSLDFSAVNSRRFVSGNEPVRIWETILTQINSFLKQKEDEDFDDEEIGNIKTSRDRKEIENKKTSKFNSKKIFERFRGRFFNLYFNYIDFLNDQWDAEDRELTLSDLSLYLILVNQLLSNVGKTVLITNKEAEDEGEGLYSDILLRFSGINYDDEAFDSLMVRVMGSFMSFCSNTTGFKTYDENINNQKLIELKKQLFIVNSICLIILKKRSNVDEILDKWILLLMLDNQQYFSMDEKQFMVEIEKYYRIFEIDFISLPELIRHLAHLYNEGKVSNNKGLYQSKSPHYTFIEGLGFCYIEKEIENPKIKGKIKYLKISNPVFCTSTFNFTFPKLYDIENDIFINSLQEKNNL